MVNLEQDLEILVIQSLDLDNTPDLEQIIVTYDKAQPQTPMELLVVESDPERDIKFIRWRTRLGAVVKNSLFVQALDITGNGLKEIVVSGFDATGRQVLAIYARSTSQGPAVTYAPIFSKAVNGIIEIQKSPYLDEINNTRDRLSYPIVTEEIESELGKDVINIIRSTWFYRVEENAFVLEKLDKISRRTETNTGNTDYSNLPFEQMIAKLEGLWFKEDQRSISLDFRPLEKVFVIGQDQTAEIFSWLSTQRPRSNVINILGTNILTLTKRIPLQTQLNILLLRDDLFVILSSFPDDIFQGAYKKYVISSEGSGRQIQSLELNGEFVGDDDLRITFTNPFIRWESGSKRQEGGYSLLKLDDWVLQVRLYEGQPAQSQTYIYRLSVSEVADNINKKIILTLEPARLSFKGLELTGSRKIILQKLIPRDS